MKEVYNGGEECYFAQSPRNCLKTHENAFVACGKTVHFVTYLQKKVVQIITYAMHKVQF